jgi:hypothetical protein
MVGLIAPPAFCNAGGAFGIEVEIPPVFAFDA